MLSALAIAQALSLAAPNADRIGTLPVVVEAELAPPDRQGVAERFASGLQRSGFALAPVRAQGADTCREPACYRDLARQTEVGHLAGATVGRDGPDYTVRVWVVSGDSGEVVAEIDGVCEICGVQELGEMVENLAARLHDKVDTSVAPSLVSIESVPSGATVHVDGEARGTTPLRLSIEPGPHEIEVTHRGYHTESTEAELRAGTNETFKYHLARSTRIPTWLPWTSLAVGVAATAAGGTLIAIDEREIQRDCNPDVDGRCEFLHDTLGGGIALTVTGVALIATGVTLAIVQHRRARPRRVRATAVGFQARF